MKGSVTDTDPRGGRSSVLVLQPGAADTAEEISWLGTLSTLVTVRLAGDLIRGARIRGGMAFPMAAGGTRRDGPEAQDTDHPAKQEEQANPARDPGPDIRQGVGDQSARGLNGQAAAAEGFGRFVIFHLESVYLAGRQRDGIGLVIIQVIIAGPIGNTGWIEDESGGIDRFLENDRKGIDGVIACPGVGIIPRRALLGQQVIVFHLHARPGDLEAQDAPIAIRLLLVSGIDQAAIGVPFSHGVQVGHGGDAQVQGSRKNGIRCQGDMADDQDGGFIEFGPQLNLHLAQVQGRLGMGGEWQCQQGKKGDNQSKN